MSRVVMIAAAAGVAACGSAASAAEPSEAKEKKAIEIINEEAKREGSFAFDYGVPTSPALTLTGLSADKITTSNSLKPFVLAIPDLVSGEGGRTIALDASPAQLAIPLQRQLYSDYVGGDLAGRIAFRTRLGVVLDRGEKPGTDPKSGAVSKLALGLSTSLLDHSDPLMTQDDDGRRYWETCVAAKIGELPAAVQQTEAERKRSRYRLGLQYADTIRLQFLGVPLGSRRLTEQVEADIKDLDAIASRDRVERPVSDTPNAAAAAALKTLREEAAKQSGAAREALLGSIASLERSFAQSQPAPMGRSVPDVNSPEFDAWLAAARKTVDDAVKALPAAQEAKDLQLADRTKSLKQCAVDASERAQNSQDLDIGGGVLWSGEKGRTAGFGDGAGVLWAAYRLPLRTFLPPAPMGDDGQKVVRPLDYWSVGGSARYAWKDTLKTGDTAKPEIKADVLDTWVGAERLTSTSRLAFQYGWFDADAKAAADRPFSRSGDRWLIAGALRVLEDQGVWLNFSYGSTNSNLDEFDDKVALVTVTFSPPTLTSAFKGN